MNNAVGIITTIKSDDLLQDITKHRCMSAVLFGGRYRLVDFALSNMVNSGLRNVGIVTSNKYRALLDHLGSGKEWSLDRKWEGLFLLPAVSHELSRKKLRLDLKDFKENIDYIERCYQKYVVIASSYVVCNFDFKEALNFHEKKRADVTVVYKELDLSDTAYQDELFIATEKDGKVAGFSDDPEEIESNKAILEMVIVERSLLLEIINNCQYSGNWDLIDILKNNLHQLNIYGYPCRGYVAKINSIKNYYKHNMELLKPEISKELFLGPNKIYTKIKDSPPSKYAKESEVFNCLIASGCNINGRVENSVIFRGVEIGKGAQVKNSIIMQKCVIKDNAVLENVILDKDVLVNKSVVLKGEAENPIIIEKKTVI